MAEIRVNATGELKLYDSDDSNYVSFKSGGTVSSNVTWTLPTADGSSGQVLSTDGSGTLSWATASSADPSSADGDTLGTASAEWSDLFLADGGTIKFGNDQDVILTHVADTALLLNAAMRLQFRDSGLYIGSNADGDLDIVSDGTAVDSINIESAGGITLDAGTAASGVIFEDDGTEMARIYNNSSDVYIESKVSDKDVYIRGNDGGSGVNALKLDMSDAGAATFNNGLTLSDGNLVVASGHGIDFSATGDASDGIGLSTTSELFDDYEEGTFTPEMRGSGGSAGSYGDSSSGFYTKIGRNVHVQIMVIPSNMGSWSGDCRIYGLPFTSADITAPGCLAIGRTNFSGINENMGAFVAGNNTYVRFREGEGLTSELPYSDANTNEYYYLSGTYIAA